MPGPPLNQVRDKVVWTANSSGKFKTKSAWKLIREIGQNVDWHKVVWCFNHIPNIVSLCGK